MTWHTIKEAAPLLGLSAEMTRRLCETRRLAHRRVGLNPGRGKIQISDAAIAAYLASCEVPAVSAEDRAAQARAKGKGASKAPARRSRGDDLRPDGKPYRFV